MCARAPSPHQHIHIHTHTNTTPLTHAHTHTHARARTHTNTHTRTRTTLAFSLAHSRRLFGFCAFALAPTLSASLVRACARACVGSRALTPTVDDHRAHASDRYHRDTARYNRDTARYDGDTAKDSYTDANRENATDRFMHTGMYIPASTDR